MPLRHYRVRICCRFHNLADSKQVYIFPEMCPRFYIDNLWEDKGALRLFLLIPAPGLSDKHRWVSRQLRKRHLILQLLFLSFCWEVFRFFRFHRFLEGYQASGQYYRIRLQFEQSEAGVFQHFEYLISMVSRNWLKVLYPRGSGKYFPPQ